MKGGIAGKLALIFSLLVLVATATVGFLVFWGASNALFESSTVRLEHTAETVEVRFFASLEAISKDVWFLAETPPVEGLMRARNGPLISRSEGRLDRLTNHSEAEWLDQLAGIFAVFLENRPSYLQIRLIGLADGGREILRMEAQGDSTVFRTPRSALQQKGTQSYFTEAVNLPEGQVYLSPIDLHREEGEVASGIPTLRVASPVHDSRGQPFGILIVNVDFRHQLRALADLVDPEVSLYLANNWGELLVRPDSLSPMAAALDQRAAPDSLVVTDSLSVEVGDSLADGDSLAVSPVAQADVEEEQIASLDSTALVQKHFPSIKTWFAGTSDVLPASMMQTEGPTLAYFERIPYYLKTDQHFLVLAATSPRDLYLDGVTKVRNRSALITVLFAVWGIILALVFSNYLTRPLRSVTHAISRFGTDDEEMNLPVRRQDEIGVLARAFDTMARQIQAQIVELEDKARRQRIILETSAEGIIVTNAEGTIETFNRAAEVLFGYKAEDVMGKNVNEVVYSPSHESRNGSAKASEDEWSLGQSDEVTGRRKDGTTFPASLALSSFELAGEKKYAGFLQDITKRKQYEQTLRQAKLTAEAANRAKSAFLANMSHEIRTPLTGIIGFASLLTRLVTGKQRKYARLIENSGERLKETLNSVLDLAKLEANRVEVELETVAIKEEVTAATQLFQAQAQEKGLDLTVDIEPGAEDAHVRLDKGGFNSILQNLIGNAIKFTEEGGVTVRLLEDEEQVYVRVEDTGVGIDKAFMPHLFDVFRQESTGLSRTHEGSGLGLSITQRLVHLMDGEISVESEKGKGSVFTVAFPVAVPQEETVSLAAGGQQDQPHLSLDAPLTKPKILLVEDNENTQYLIESLLEEDFEVTIVGNAEEALLEAFRVEFDIVLLDINLGDGPNGADVLRELRAMPAYHDVPIAAITAYALPGDQERFRELGFSAYLSKPFNADELLELTARLS
ncbi:MAG TPA: ATP-binding protein [Rhodothermales bacterium]|nr:ATP-binding protein [Rhodothermales bacterium]